MSEMVAVLVSGKNNNRYSLLADFIASFRNPEFWALSSWLDIVVRYRQSRLGVFWLFAPAIIYTWGLGGFFSAISKIPLSEFAVYTGLGYVLYRLFSTVIVDSTSAFDSASAFIMDGHSRLTDFVLRTAAKSMLYFIVSLPVMAVALWLSPEPHWSGLVVSLPALVLVIVNLLWIGVVFGLIGARFQDLAQFVGHVFMFAFLLTPIVWHADSMPKDSFRYTLMLANPLYHMVELVRAPLLGDPVTQSNLIYLAVMTVFGWLVAVLAYRRYAKFVPIWI